MAAALIYLRNQVPSEGLESDETDKLTSAELIDCNKNQAKNTKIKEINEGVKQSSSDPTEKEIGNSDNKKEENLVLASLNSENSISEEISNLICGNNSSCQINVAEISPEVATSGSACVAQTNKKISNHDSFHYNETSSEDTSTENKNNNKESYSQIKSKRKTLLKIEKLTDSDNRSRDKMRRRALSPPSSSDEENLYIGWIAYPASLTSFRRTGRKPRREIWMKAVKFIFYPVTKFCQKCIRNKVGDVGSV